MNTNSHDVRPTLLLVDDEPANLQVLRHTLQNDYRLLFAKQGQAALELVAKDRPDLILLDIMMPDLSGYEICQRLKDNPLHQSIPVIFITALSDAEHEQKGLEMGAVDYISKPFNPHIVKARVRTHLSLVRAEEISKTRLQIIQCLGAAAEYRDNETGLHVIRMSHVAKILAIAAGYSEEAANEIFHAAPMHDVGKIGIPDAILQKPGKLTEEEFAVMRQHPVIGAKILGDHPAGLLKLAASIALNHHEKWDGSGYPRGLKGEEIPLSARIVAIADVFDALVNTRPYKAAWPVEKAVALLDEQSGKHFDPQLVELFKANLETIRRVQAEFGE